MGVAGCLLLLLCARAPADGERAPLPPEVQGEVNRAIDRGVSFLQAAQLFDGSWQQPRHSHRVGYAALPALTLLECGVSPQDPIIQRAAQFVRLGSLKLDATYEISLAILFLDRLGNPVDDKLIRLLALRLVVSQTATGGWGYKCFIPNGRDNLDLMVALKRLTPKRPPPAIARKPDPKPDLEKPAPRKPEDLGPGITRRPARGDLDPLARAGGKSALEGAPTSTGSSRGQSQTPAGSGSVAPFPSDSSSPSPRTVSPDLDRKPAKPAEAQTTDSDGKPDSKPADPAPEKPYVLPDKLRIVPVLQNHEAQLLVDPPRHEHQALLATTDNSNTQFAILGLWTAQRHGIPIDLSLKLITRRYETSQNENGSWGYHYQNGGGEPESPAMTAVGLIGLGLSESLNDPDLQRTLPPRIKKGFQALGNHIGTPADRITDLPMPNLYFLWSIERVGVLYRAPLIGNKDWYRWGVELLLANQTPDGYWQKGGYPGSDIPLDTSLALLFLKRANLTKSLAATPPPQARVLKARIDLPLSPDPPPSSPPPSPTPVPKTIEAEGQPSLEAPQEINKSLDLSGEVAADPPADPLPEPPPAAHGSLLWLVLLLGIVLLALLGSGLFLFLHFNGQKKEDDSEEEEE